MPLAMMKTGEPGTIKKVGGREDTRRFLESLGFVTGAIVTVVSHTGGNMIVNIKNSRVAIGKEMAGKILIWLFDHLYTKKEIERDSVWRH